eukprot:3755776-Pleurochrysis_carterae.AAC.1
MISGIIPEWCDTNNKREEGNTDEDMDSHKERTESLCTANMGQQGKNEQSIPDLEEKAKT